MSEVRPAYDDEIDLFEFFETLWDGKWLIVAFVSFAILVGFGYSQFGQSKYEVSVPFVVEVYSVSSQQICGNNVGCMEDEESKSILSLLGEGWEKKGSELSITTENPLDKIRYEEKFADVNRSLTKNTYVEAENELRLIQNELAEAFLSTEIVATNMLNAKRIIQSVDGGQKVISFGSVSMGPSPKFSLILALCIVLGGVVGVLFVLVRKAVCKRKEQLKEV